MDTLLKNRTGFPLGILSAMVITGLLYLALPLLTHFQPDQARKVRSQAVLINTRRPPPPPMEEPEQVREQEMLEKQETRKQIKQTRRSQPKFDIPKVTLAMGAGGISGIEIGMVSDFRISDSLFMSAFRLTEVDQPPRVLRVFPPQYPYRAKRDGIEGHVMLKFVVDVNGLARESRVVEAEPEGIFEESALRALERYRFRPAVKNGKPVSCIVNLPVSFQLM